MNVLTSVWPSPFLTSVLPGWRVFSNVSSLLFIILSLQTKVLLNPHRDNRGVSENKSGQTAVKQMSERRRIRLIVLSTVRPLLGSCAHLTPTYVCTWFEFVATYTPGLVLNNGKMHPHKPSHRLPHLQSAHTGKKKTNHCSEAACWRAASQRSGRETHIQAESERQESPYIALRKSCVRTGSSFFGHGGFLWPTPRHWSPDISSTVGFWREDPSRLEGDCRGGGDGGPGRTCSSVSAAALPPSLPPPPTHPPLHSWYSLQRVAEACSRPFTGWQK